MAVFTVQLGYTCNGGETSFKGRIELVKLTKRSICKDVIDKNCDLGYYIKKQKKEKRKKLWMIF